MEAVVLFRTTTEGCEEAMESFAFPDEIKMKLTKLLSSYKKITLMRKFFQQIFVKGTFLCEIAFKLHVFV